MKHIRSYKQHLNENESKVTLPKALIEKIQSKLESMPSPSIYWDYNDQLSDKDVQKILEGKGQEMFDEIFDSNLDNIADLERSHLKEALDSFTKELEALYGEDVDTKELANELIELFDISVDPDFEQLMKNTGEVNCRVELNSNYEGLRSDYDETRSGYTYDGAFKQIVDALNLNPKKVKESLGDDAAGKFPDLKKRDGNEYVSYKDFEQELRNNTTLSRLTFMCKIDLRSILDEDNNFPQKFYVPKGNECGLFSSFQGGGSLLEMTLLKPILIDTKRTKGEYDYYSICVDDAVKYSIDSVYGMSGDAFGGIISKAE